MFRLSVELRSCINPFIAPACKMSGLRNAGTCLQTAYFQSYNASTFSAARVLIKIVSYATAKKKTKRLKGFKFRAVIGRFKVTSWQ